MCLVHMFSTVGMVLWEGGNLGKRNCEKMAKGSLEVYKDCTTKVVHPTPNTKIHTVIVCQGALSYRNNGFLLGTGRSRILALLEFKGPGPCGSSLHSSIAAKLQVNRIYLENNF